MNEVNKSLQFFKELNSIHKFPKIPYIPINISLLTFITNSLIDYSLFLKEFRVKCHTYFKITTLLIINHENIVSNSTFVSSSNHNQTIN